MYQDRNNPSSRCDCKPSIPRDLGWYIESVYRSDLRRSEISHDHSPCCLRSIMRGVALQNIASGALWSVFLPYMQSLIKYFCWAGRSSNLTIARHCVSYTKTKSNEKSCRCDMYIHLCLRDKLRAILSLLILLRALGYSPGPRLPDCLLTPYSPAENSNKIEKTISYTLLAQYSGFTKES